MEEEAKGKQFCHWNSQRDLEMIKKNKNENKDQCIKELQSSVASNAGGNLKNLLLICSIAALYFLFASKYCEF